MVNTAFPAVSLCTMVNTAFPAVSVCILAPKSLQFLRLTVGLVSTTLRHWIGHVMTMMQLETIISVPCLAESPPMGRISPSISLGHIGSAVNVPSKQCLRALFFTELVTTELQSFFLFSCPVIWQFSSEAVAAEMS